MWLQFVYITVSVNLVGTISPDSKWVGQECGKEFVGNCRTKRLICENCWKKDRKERDRKRKTNSAGMQNFDLL